MSGEFSLPAPPKTFALAGTGYAFGLGCGLGPFFGMGVALPMAFGAGVGIGAYCGVGWGGGAVVGCGAGWLKHGAVLPLYFAPRLKWMEQRVRLGGVLRRALGGVWGFGWLFDGDRDAVDRRS